MTTPWPTRSWNERAHPDPRHPPLPRHLADRLPFLELSPHNAVTHLEDWRVVAEPPRSRVCIVGAGLYYDQAPLDDPSWMVWALNLVAPYDGEGRLRCDAWFDLHQRVAQTADDLRWIASCPVPIYLPDDLLDASPRAVRYPIEWVEAELRASYFSCSFAYQIALAMCDDTVTDIGLYGLELAYGTDRERTVEWACVAYWIGRAVEHGIRIHTPGRTTLGRHPARYGLEYYAELDAVSEYTDVFRQHAPVRDVGSPSPPDHPIREPMKGV